MRWPTFLTFAFLGLVLETSLRRLFVLESFGHISPSLLICLVVFLALFAGRRAALWGAWALGILMDLMVGLAQSGLNEQVFILGPHALGYVFAAALILQVRTMVFRRRLVTIAVLTGLAVIAAGLVGIAFYVVRSYYPQADVVHYPIERGAMRELGQRFGVALYSALAAVPLGWLLRLSIPVWGFTGMTPRHGERG